MTDFPHLRCCECLSIGLVPPEPKVGKCLSKFTANHTSSFEWHLKTVIISRQLHFAMGGSICRCCNFTLLYAVLNIFSLFSSIVGDYCDPVLNQTPLQCQLRTYRTEEAIKCFDILSVNRSAPFHLLFVGDSRTRQQFFSFQKVSFSLVVLGDPWRTFLYTKL